MDFVFVTGKLGQGKTLVSISRIKHYIEQGRPVATNCDLFLHHMFNRETDKPRVMRVPDKPKLCDLEAIGRAYPKAKGYNENMNGLLVLDECGDWFNSRNWQDKTRSGVNTWFRHARKLGWDVYLIVQDISLIDSQARESLAASIARCKRMDKIAIPFLTMASKALTGYPLRMNKFHVAKVTDADDVLLDRWIYRGSELYAAYDTQQIFNAEYEHCTYSLLTPWHIYGRHKIKMNWANKMRITKIYWKRFNKIIVAAIASGITALVVGSFAKYAIAEQNEKLQLLESTATNKNDDTKKEIDTKETFNTKFDGWNYDGATQINNRIVYYFTDKNGTRYTSKSHAIRNYEIKEHAFCLVELIDKVTDSAIMLECASKQQLATAT